MVASSVRLLLLGTLQKKRSVVRIAPPRQHGANKSALDPYGITGQGQPGRGDAGRPIRGGPIADKAIGRVHLIEKVVEGLALQPAQVSRASILFRLHLLAAVYEAIAKIHVAWCQGRVRGTAALLAALGHEPPYLVASPSASRNRLIRLALLVAAPAVFCAAL